jgi:Uma2 family endonuclease
LFLRLHQLVESLNAGSADLALGEVLFGMGYKIGRKPDSWLIPDVGVTHRDQPGEEYCEGAPLIAIEVISEFKMAAKMDRKIEKYLANGAQEVWVVYGETRRVLTHFAGSDVVEIGRAHTRSRALAGVSGIPLSEIW